MSSVSAISVSLTSVIEELWPFGGGVLCCPLRPKPSDFVRELRMSLRPQSGVGEAPPGLHDRFRFTPTSKSSPYQFQVRQGMLAHLVKISKHCEDALKWIQSARTAGGRSWFKCSRGCLCPRGKTLSLTTVKDQLGGACYTRCQDSSKAKITQKSSLKIGTNYET